MNMPPETPSVSIPTTRGKDALLYLQHHGILPRPAAIRSGTWESSLSPFQFYLTDRLGIIPAFSWSKALSRGSWLHRRARLFFSEVDNRLPYEDDLAFTNQLTDRCAELRAIAGTFKLPSTKTLDMIERENRDFSCATGWFQTARTVPIPGFGTLESFLHQPHWRCLGTELRLSLRDLLYPLVPLVCTLDVLLYHAGQNSLWVLDWKTTSISPKARLELCPIEHQTWHYLYILRSLLASGHLHSLYPQLPANVTIGGMMHVAIQKPTIEFSGNDRDFELIEFTPKSGKNKGVTRLEKTYYGEPRLPNYIDRCSRWGRGTDEYSHLAELRAKDPVVNISFSSHSVLDDNSLAEYHQRTSLAYHYATCSPLPSNFPRSTGHLLANADNPYLPFYVLPVSQWPDVIRREGFILTHRDEEPITEEPESPSHV